MTPPIAQEGDWLEEQNEGGSILVSPHLWDQVPSRMMLAMGDYSALQSFDERHPVGALTPRRRAHARNPRKNTTAGTSYSTRTSPTGVPWSTGSSSTRTPTFIGSPSKIAPSSSSWRARLRAPSRLPFLRSTLRKYLHGHAGRSSRLRGTGRDVLIRRRRGSRTPYAACLVAVLADARPTAPLSRNAGVRRRPR